MSSRSRSNRQRRRRRADSSGHAGFTLLEVLVSMVILVFIAFSIYEAVTETYRLREILSQEGDFYNSIRLAMNVMNRDVSLIYSPVNAIPSPTVSGAPVAPSAPVAAANAQQAGDLAQESKYWGPALDKSGTRPSRFIGDTQKMTFISASHLRVYKGSQESEFAKIEYSIDKDDLDPNLNMLVKTESTDVFEDEERKDKTFRSYRLLHGIKSMKIAYFQKKGDTFTSFNRWDSDQEEFKNIYPDYIELNIEVEGPAKLSFDGQYRFRPEFPLNGLDPST
jgi:general secretion pathway protein J